MPPKMPVSPIDGTGPDIDLRDGPTDGGVQVPRKANQSSHAIGSPSIFVGQPVQDLKAALVKCHWFPTGFDWVSLRRR
jgi:hypothetical protein